MDKKDTVTIDELLSMAVHKNDLKGTLHARTGKTEAYVKIAGYAYGTGTWLDERYKGLPVLDFRTDPKSGEVDYWIDTTFTHSKT